VVEGDETHPRPEQGGQAAGGNLDVHLVNAVELPAVPRVLADHGLKLFADCTRVFDVNHAAFELTHKEHDEVLLLIHVVLLMLDHLLP
jgi:hypothetical protein